MVWYVVGCLLLGLLQDRDRETDNCGHVVVTSDNNTFIPLLAVVGF